LVEDLLRDLPELFLGIRGLVGAGQATEDPAYPVERGRAARSGIGTRTAAGRRFILLLGLLLESGTTLGDVRCGHVGLLHEALEVGAEAVGVRSLPVDRAHDTGQGGQQRLERLGSSLEGGGGLAQLIGVGTLEGHGAISWRAAS